MFENGLNRYRMFFSQSLHNGAIATSATLLGSLIGVCVVTTISSFISIIAEKYSPQEALFFLVAGVTLWTVLVFVFTAVIAYNRYKNDQRQFRKEVGFSEGK